MQPKSYDVIIIGSGQAGTPLSRAFANAGKKTALVEKLHVAGTCINEGCTPTKTMVASARVAYLAGRAGDYGVQTGPVHVDMAKVRQRKRRVVESFRRSNERRLHENNVDLIMGTADFRSRSKIHVETNQGEQLTLEADTIVINTGGRPRIPDLPGIDRLDYLTSTTVMELDQVPEHLIILGGGYVGVEFGQMFRRFGAEVTIVQRAGQLLPREDADVVSQVTEILEEDGVGVLLDAQAASVEAGQHGGVLLNLQTSAGERQLSGSHLLVATGRSPNSDHLNLSAAGVEVDSRGYIAVNERLETSVPGIYAAGDVKGGPAFTHISYDDYRVLKTNLIDGGQASIAGRMVPYVVYMDPQLGRIGLSENEARQHGLDVKIAKIPMGWVARAIETDETRGLLKAVVDAGDGQILGFTMLGIEGGEVMAAVQIAMMGKLHYTRLRDGIFSHPSLSEALNTLFGAIDDL